MTDRPGALTRLARALARFGPFRWIGRRVVPPVDRLLYRLTGGRWQLGTLAVPMLVLTVAGRRSGEPRTVPLAYVPSGRDLILVGSNWGQERHPAWTANLLAADEATVNVRGHEHRVRPVLLEGAAREAVWDRVVAAWPVYADYEDLAGGRTLRVFRLEVLDAD